MQNNIYTGSPIAVRPYNHTHCSAMVSKALDRGAYNGPSSLNYNLSDFGVLEPWISSHFL